MINEKESLLSGGQDRSSAEGRNTNMLEEEIFQIVQSKAENKSIMGKTQTEFTSKIENTTSPRQLLNLTGSSFVDQSDQKIKRITM